MRYLLDTNVLSALVRDPHGGVMKRIRKVGEANVCTSIIVAAELRFGAAKKRSARLLAQVEAVLGALEVLPFEAPVAVHALATDCTIVTANEKEFSRARGLKVENWLRD